MVDRKDDFIELLYKSSIDTNTCKIKELTWEKLEYLLLCVEEAWITTHDKSKLQIMKQIHTIIVNANERDILKQKNQVEILTVFLYHYEQLFEKSDALRPSKYELTILFIAYKFNATSIKFLVNQYRSFFKDIAFVDDSDFIMDWLGKDQSDLLNTNMNKINTYYKMGLIKKYLYPEKIDYYSKKVFEETGHNNKHVKPIKGLGLEFVFGSKTFASPELN